MGSHRNKELLTDYKNFGGMKIRVDIIDVEMEKSPGYLTVGKHPFKGHTNCFQSQAA
jgi:hypothetical protein